MEKKKQYTLVIVSCVLVLGLLLSIMLPQPTAAAQWLKTVWAQRASPIRASAASLNGIYAGQVALDYAVPGEYTDTLPPPVPGDDPLPDMGTIDLGLQLEQDGNSVEGYVDLEHTLVFTGEHTVGPEVFGPSLTGTFNGTDLYLESERVSLVSAGQNLMRQFRLTGGVNPDVENQLTGEYRETVWGYGLKPLTVVGQFTLEWSQPAATDFFFLPMIFR